MPTDTLDSDADRPFFKRPPRHSKPQGPVPDLNDLKPKTARVGLPKGLRDIEMVHELCLEHNAAIPEYRAEQYEPGRRASDRKRIAEWVRIYLGTNAWIMFDFLSFYSRQYQLTAPGIVKRLNDFGAVDKTSTYFVQAGIRKLIDNGLAERLPVRDHKKALGFMVRLKHRSEWPITLNPGGKTLKEIKAQVGYNETQGRVVPPKRGDRPFHNGTAAAIYKLDGFTGEVIDKATGAVAFVIHHRSRERWGAFKFLKKHVLHQCGNPWGQVPRETGYIKEGVKNSEPKVLKKGTSGEFVFSEASSPVDGLFQQPGEAGGAAAAPRSTQTTPDRSAAPADAEGGADEDAFDVLTDVVLELKRLHREWRKHERRREPGEVEGAGRDYLEKHNRYVKTFAGDDVVPPYIAKRTYMVDGVPFVADGVHAPFYLCEGSGHYTITDVQRWYLNAPEANMIRGLNGDTLGTDLIGARLWMRQFVDHARAGTHMEFLACFQTIEMVELNNLAAGRPRRIYTNAELKKFKTLEREVYNEHIAPIARHVGRALALETMSGSALTVMESLEPDGKPETDWDVVNADASAALLRRGPFWVPTTAIADMEDCVRVLWAARQGDDEFCQVDKILDNTTRSYRLFALYHTKAGRDICHVVENAVHGSRFTGHFFEDFVEAFDTTPAEVYNEHMRHIDNDRRLRVLSANDEEMLNY